MLLHRHRVSTLFTKDDPKAWSAWYSNGPTKHNPNVEVQSREFASDQVRQVRRRGSSKAFGSLYEEVTP
jgi:hypothetical protein